MGNSDDRKRRRICGCAAIPRVIEGLHGTGTSAHNISHLLQVLTLKPVPSFFEEGYRQLCAVLGLQPQPPLYFAETAFNMFAFYSDGVIVVGTEEIDPLIQQLWGQADAGLLQAVQADFVTRMQRTPSPDELFMHFSRLAYLLIMAHELGHALQARGVRAPYTDEEAASDYFAGKACYRLGLPQRLGELLFYDLGCEGPMCNHPPPAVRESAFDAGYEAARVESHPPIDQPPPPARPSRPTPVRPAAPAPTSASSGPDLGDLVAAFLGIVAVGGAVSLLAGLGRSDRSQRSHTVRCGGCGRAGHNIRTCPYT